jgi:streptomycin 6-kinase
LTPPPASRQRFAVTAFVVPRYLAETARRDPDVRGWLAGLPAIVADLAGRWSLRVGEPFQPGGQCSWTAPVTGPGGPGLVLKVGFRFPGGEERDEAAGLRVWEGNGAVRLHAACETGSAYGLLIERCVPGTPLGQARPGPEQDRVVARAAAAAMGAAARGPLVPPARADVRGVGR